MGNSFVKDLVLTFILTDSGDLSQSKEYLKAIKVSWRPLCTMILILSFGVGDMHNYPLSATPPPQNGQTHSNNSSAFVVKLFECV